jgi:acyl dehydratase
LRLEAEVLGIIPSKSRPTQGVVKMKITTLNQKGEPVQILVANMIALRRPS